MHGWLFALSIPLQVAKSTPLFERALLAGNVKALTRRGQLAALLCKRFGNRTGGVTALIHQKVQGFGFNRL
jgi:hypothetical protein